MNKVLIIAEHVAGQAQCQHRQVRELRAGASRAAQIDVAVLAADGGAVAAAGGRARGRAAGADCSSAPENAEPLAAV